MVKNNKSYVITETVKEILAGDDGMQNLKDSCEKFIIRDRLLTDNELPIVGFDISNSLAINLEDFGASTSFDDIGRFVRYVGNAKIIDSDGKKIKMSQNNVYDLTADDYYDYS